MQRSPLPHLHREWAHAAHIYTETGPPVAPRVDQVYDVAESETAAKRVHLPNPTRARAGANTSYPTNIVFKENPGGEYRKSYHGYPATSCPGPGHICRRTSWPAKENALFIRYPSGYAQLIASPNQWLVEPMQIDTHNRNYSLTDTPGCANSRTRTPTRVAHAQLLQAYYKRLRFVPWFLPKKDGDGMTQRTGSNRSTRSTRSTLLIT